MQPSDVLRGALDRLSTQVEGEFHPGDTMEPMRADVPYSSYVRALFCLRRSIGISVADTVFSFEQSVTGLMTSDVRAIYRRAIQIAEAA